MSSDVILDEKERFDYNLFVELLNGVSTRDYIFFLKKKKYGIPYT